MKTVLPSSLCVCSPGRHVHTEEHALLEWDRGKKEFSVTDCTYMDEQREFGHQAAQLLQVLRGGAKGQLIHN